MTPLKQGVLDKVAEPSLESLFATPNADPSEPESFVHRFFLVDRFGLKVYRPWVWRGGNANHFRCLVFDLDGKIIDDYCLGYPHMLNEGVEMKMDRFSKRDEPFYPRYTTDQERFDELIKMSGGVSGGSN